MSDEAGKRVEDNSNWLWWTAGIFLFLAYCNYSGRDQQPETATVPAGMSYAQATAYQDCMTSSGGYNLSENAQRVICRKSALGYGGGSDCHTAWDGRANGTICE